MQSENRGRTLGLCLLLVAVAMLGGALSGLFAANNSAPTGWLMANRDRAKYAMGTEVVYLAHCAANTTLPATGLLSSDVVWGIVDVETAGAWALLPITTTLTIANDLITSSGTPYTAGNMYMVLAHRAQTSDR